MDDYFRCPVCGARLPIEATFCPECYSDEETGWSEAARYDGLLSLDPDEELTPRRSAASGFFPKIIYAAIAILTVISFLLYAVNGNPIMIPIALGAIALAYFWSQKRAASVIDPGQALYQDLLHRARGDETLVERWLEYERQRSPSATQIELMKDALFRWHHDNR